MLQQIRADLAQCHLALRVHGERGDGSVRFSGRIRISQTSDSDVIGAQDFSELTGQCRVIQTSVVLQQAGKAQVNDFRGARSLSREPSVGSIRPPKPGSFHGAEGKPLRLINIVQGGVGAQPGSRADGQITSA